MQFTKIAPTIIQHLNAFLPDDATHDDEIETVMRQLAIILKQLPLDKLNQIPLTTNLPKLQVALAHAPLGQNDVMDDLYSMICLADEHPYQLTLTNLKELAAILDNWENYLEGDDDVCCDWEDNLTGEQGITKA